MDREQLAQLRFLSKEVRLIEEQIRNIKYTVCSDSVKGSTLHFPYIYGSIPIEGINLEEHSKKVKRLKTKLFKRKTELIDLVSNINEYINNIDDSEIRQIIVLKYVNGLTWDSVARYLQYADESVPRKKLDRYFKMTDKSETDVL